MVSTDDSDSDQPLVKIRQNMLADGNKAETKKKTKMVKKTKNAGKRTTSRDKEAIDTDDEPLVKLVKKSKKKAAKRSTKRTDVTQDIGDGDVEKSNDFPTSQEEMRRKVAEMLESSSENDEKDINGEEKSGGEKKTHFIARKQEAEADNAVEEAAEQASDDEKGENITEEQQIKSDNDEAETPGSSNNNSDGGKISNEKAKVTTKAGCAVQAKEKVREKKNSGGETSDTSIDDRLDTESPPKKIKKMTKSTLENESNDASSKKKNEDLHSSRLKKLKRFVTLAGLRFCYKKLFDGIESDKKRIKVLENALHEKGVSSLTVEGCKNFRLKREEEQELAELSRNPIIAPESDVRVTRSSRRAGAAQFNKRVARLSTSSSDANSETEKLREENMQIFSRLKGIVSDESD